MRLIQSTIALFVLLAGLTAQDPNPPKPPEKTPPVVKQERVKEEPAKQDPAKQDPATGDATKQDPKTDKAGKDGKTDKDGADGKGKTDDVEESDVELPEDTPIPVSADPADIRAMRSAQDMLAAERRMRALIKAGKMKDIDKLVSFEELSAWPYEDGLKGTPKAVRKLDGKTVLMTGFMLPIDEVENIREFLLVQSLWACCYGQPPDINGIVRVVMKGDARCDYQFDPIKVKGTFRVQETREDGYCIDIYQLHADSVGLIK